MLFAGGALPTCGTDASAFLRGGTLQRFHDLAVTLDSVAKQTSLPLFEETLYIVGPSGQFTPDAEVTVEHALGLPLILPMRRHGIRILLERQALISGRELNIVREIEGVASTKAAIRAGLGLRSSGAARSIPSKKTELCPPSLSPAPVSPAASFSTCRPTIRRRGPSSRCKKFCSRLSESSVLMVTGVASHRRCPQSGRCSAADI